MNNFYNKSIGNIYSKTSNNWEESIKLVIQNDLSNNVPDLYDLYLEKLDTPELHLQALRYDGLVFGVRLGFAEVVQSILPVLREFLPHQ